MKFIYTNKQNMNLQVFFEKKKKTHILKKKKSLFILFTHPICHEYHIFIYRHALICTVIMPKTLQLVKMLKKTTAHLSEIHLQACILSNDNFLIYLLTENEVWPMSCINSQIQSTTLVLYQCYTF